MNFRVEIERVDGEMEFDSFQFDEDFRYEIETFIHECHKRNKPHVTPPFTDKQMTLRTTCSKCGFQYFTEFADRFEKKLCVACDDTVSKPRIVRENYS